MRLDNPDHKPVLGLLLSVGVFMLLRLLLFNIEPVRDSWLQLSDITLQLD